MNQGTISRQATFCLANFRMVPKVLVISYFPNDNIISSLLKSHGNSNLIGTLSNIQQSLTSKDLGTMISGLKVYSVPW